MLHLKAISGRLPASAYTISCSRRKPSGILGENTSAATRVVFSVTFSTQNPSAFGLAEGVGFTCGPMHHSSFWSHQVLMFVVA